MTINRPTIGLGARHPGVLMRIVRRGSDFDRVVDGDVWEKVANVRVSFVQQTGREVSDLQEVVGRHYETAWIRYPGFPVHTSMRLDVRNEQWQIASAVNVEGRNRWIKLQLVRTEDVAA